MNGGDISAWVLNVASSVVIVFVNKLLMGSQWQFGFKFATVLSGFHFLTCAFSLKLTQFLGFTEGVNIPFVDTLIYALVANVSIASLNISLMLNTVGFYQIAKLLIIPTVGFAEFFIFGKKLTSGQVVAVLVVMAGVGTVTISQINMNLVGTIVAAISVVTSAAQQLLCGQLQRKHSISSHQLLSNTALLQGIILCGVGPNIDLLVTKQWVWQFYMSAPVLMMIALSCGVALLVNLSQYMCLGRFSAVTFQVLSHTKTMLVLIGGWLFLSEDMHVKKVIGMSLAVGGMVSYAHQVQQAKIRQQNEKDSAKNPLISKLEKVKKSGMSDCAIDIEAVTNQYQQKQTKR